jgi:hypothetical protein
MLPTFYGIVPFGITGRFPDEPSRSLGGEGSVYTDFFTSHEPSQPSEIRMHYSIYLKAEVPGIQ